MSVKVVGKQNLDFSTDKGERIEGVKLHILGADKNVQGQAVFTEFVSPYAECYEDACNLIVGSSVTLVYNRKGKVEEIIPCKDLKNESDTGKNK